MKTYTLTEEELNELVAERMKQAKEKRTPQGLFKDVSFDDELIPINKNILRLLKNSTKLVDTTQLKTSLIKSLIILVRITKLFLTVMLRLEMFTTISENLFLVFSARHKTENC